MSLSENSKNVLVIIGIVVATILPRIIFLESIPPNISGDEVTNLNDIYKILFQNQNFFLQFMGDGSEFGINFYFPSFLIKLFGITNAIFIYRLYTSLLSVLSVVAFYFLVRERTNKTIAFSTSLLLSTNYVFLNFSRTAWVNMETIFWGITTICFLEIAIKKRIILLFILGGITGGMLLYGYNYGRILIFGICIYLLVKLFRAWSKELITRKGLILFFIFLFLFSLPAIIAIYFDNSENVTRRARATFAFRDLPSISSSSSIRLMIHQAEYTLRGLVFLDGKVMSEGIENRRYLPLNKPPVDLLTKILFLAGFIHVVYRKKIGIWSVVFITSLITVFLNELPPNYSRGLFTIPFIYYVISIFIFDLKTYADRKYPKLYNTYKTLIFIIVLLSIYNLNTYFTWMRSGDLAMSRQPAIEYYEYEKWQNSQIQRVKHNLIPLNNYEWYESNPRIKK